VVFEDTSDEDYTPQPRSIGGRKRKEVNNLDAAKRAKN
jgi:hypothetical protein